LLICVCDGVMVVLDALLQYVTDLRCMLVAQYGS